MASSSPESRVTEPEPRRHVTADQVAFVVDGDRCFTAVAEAIARAQHSIVIVGWDLHTEVRLWRDGRRPDTLGAILEEAARRTLEALTNRMTGPLIVMGDFNEWTRWCLPRKRFAAGNTGGPGTYPSRC
jgi:phosphatidylserine/phosphatidylglycerophosphate/cardiolipin synthase-like enzyme